MEDILGILNRIRPLSPPLHEHLSSLLECFEFKRKGIIQREKQIANHIYFIEKGLVRSYFYKHGKEVSNWFMQENDIIVSVQSFFLRKPAYEILEALEDTTLWGISHQQLHATYDKFPEFNYHRAVILEKYYALSEQRNHLTKMQLAFYKYIDLIEIQAGLINRVPNKYLASYLGIGEGTLSRMRSKYLKLKPNNVPSWEGNS